MTLEIALVLQLANPGAPSEPVLRHGPSSIVEPFREASAESRVRKARQKFQPDRLLRVTFTDLPRFEGYASRADEEGFHALRPALDVGSTPPPPEVVLWSRIQRVERRAGSAGVGAFFGSIVLGAAGLVAGSVAAASFENGVGETAAGATLGAVAGVFLGAGLGALIGAPIPRWERIY